eukprot:gene1059-4756_t
MINQQWIYNETDSSIRWGGDTNLCVDLPGGDDTDGSGLWVWDCYQGVNQQWEYDFLTQTIQYKQDRGGKCVDLPSDKMENGNFIEIWECLKNEAQIWE